MEHTYLSLYTECLSLQYSSLVLLYWVYLSKFTPFWTPLWSFIAVTFVSSVACILAKTCTCKTVTLVKIKVQVQDWTALSCPWTGGSIWVDLAFKSFVERKPLNILMIYYQFLAINDNFIVFSVFLFFALTLADWLGVPEGVCVNGFWCPLCCEPSYQRSLPTCLGLLQWATASGAASALLVPAVAQSPCQALPRVQIWMLFCSVISLLSILCNIYSES